MASRSNDFRRLKRDTLDSLADIALEELSAAARPHSETISSTLERSIKRGIAIVESPYFWSGYLDQGRGAIRARRGKVLVWFRRREDDPRTGGRYPRKRSQVRKLTKSEYEAGLKANARARAAGRPVPMVITTESRAVPGKNFVAPAVEQVERRGREEIGDDLRGFITRQLNTVPNGRVRVDF